MTTAFPQALDSYSTKVDGSDDVMAAHINDPQDAIVAIETYLRGARFDQNLLADSLTHEASWLAGTTFNDLTDDSYAGALWNILNDSGSFAAPDVAGVAGGGTDPFTRYMALTLDATAQIGICQFLTAQQTRALRGQVVSLSADLWGTGISNVRMAVAYWTGTGDAVTSDMVGTWAAGSPTLAANWAYIGTPADIAISTSRTRKAVQNLTVPTNANNLAVFIWLPAQEVSTDVLNVARVKLEPGAAATEFVARDPGEELRLISHFYTKSYAVGVAPGTNTLVNMAMAEAYSTSLASTNNAEFPVAMRTTPTITIYSTAGTAGKISTTVPADIGTSVTSVQPGDRRIPALSDSGAGLTANVKYFFHYVADARL